MILKKSYHCGQVVLIESSKALVQPEVVPPGTGDEVSKPHVGDFVGHNISYTLLVKVV